MRTEGTAALTVFTRCCCFVTNVISLSDGILHVLPRWTFAVQFTVGDTGRLQGEYPIDENSYSLRTALPGQRIV